MKNLCLFLVLALLVPVVFSNPSVDKKITIQPILVFHSMPDSDGYEAQTDKFPSQTGIEGNRGREMMDFAELTYWWMGWCPPE